MLLESAEKRPRRIVPEDLNEALLDSQVNQLQVVDASDNEETPTAFHISENTPKPMSRRRGRAWKKDARQSG